MQNLKNTWKYATGSDYLPDVGYLDLLDQVSALNDTHATESNWVINLLLRTRNQSWLSEDDRASAVLDAIAALGPIVPKPGYDRAIAEMFGAIPFAR